MQDFVILVHPAVNGSGEVGTVGASLIRAILSVFYFVCQVSAELTRLRARVMLTSAGIYGGRSVDGLVRPGDVSHQFFSVFRGYLL